MPYGVAVTYRSKPGEEEEIANALSQMVGPTRQEPGCLGYEALRSREDPAVFFLFELYADEEAFQAHAAAEYFDRHIKQSVWLRLVSRERLLLDTLA
jgi:quinol monooxygenase YgiN